MFPIRWPRDSRGLSNPSVCQSTKASVRRCLPCPCVTALRSKSHAQDRWSDVGPPRALPEAGVSGLPTPAPAAHPQPPVRPRPSTPGSGVNHFLCTAFFVPPKARRPLAHSSASLSVEWESERPPHSFAEVGHRARTRKPSARVSDDYSGDTSHPLLKSLISCSFVDCGLLANRV